MVLGPIRQNGYIVRDLDAAIQYWVECMGVGPFFVLPVTTFSYCHFQGRETHPELGVALANWGDLQIELIQQINDEPSYYTDFLDTYGPGMQHVAIWAEHFDAERARFEESGATLVMDSKLSHGIRAAIYGNAGFAGAQLEIMEFPQPVRERMEFIRQAAIGWDGSDPIRQLDRSEMPGAPRL